MQKNCEKSSVPSVKSVKQVVKSYVDENDRSRSFIIVYGAKEEKGEHTLELVEDLLLAMNEEKKHQVLGSLRLGTIKKDSDSVRPIKVTLGSAAYCSASDHLIHLIRKFFSGVCRDIHWFEEYLKIIEIDDHFFE